MIKILNKEKGFTLVETIIYIAIVSVIFISFISFILFVKDNEKDSSLKWTINRESQKIMSILEIVINDSTEVVSPSSGDNFSSITLNTKTPADNPTTIYLFENDLILDKNGNLDQINSDDVSISNFQIYNLSNNEIPETIRIEFTISATTSDKTAYSENFYTSFTLRDYD